MKRERAVGTVVWLLSLASLCAANDLMPATTLSDATIKYRVAETPYVVLERSAVRAVIVDNRAVDDDFLPGHRAGYSGIARLSHTRRHENLFVPNYSGLNFEHIHDGTVQDRPTLFEPRNAPMQLRVIDKFTCELYQAATPHWELESCLRYQMLADGTIEMTLECIPRAESFANGYIGLFWASYIHQPESLDIHFRGHGQDEDVGKTRWVRGITPSHGTMPTHLGSDDRRLFPHDDQFPLTLVFNRSNYRFTEPWYFGVSHGMALVQVFRPNDMVRISQSPTGGGPGNPAWDYQWFIPHYEVGRRYQFVMRAIYTPFESVAQIEQVSRQHRDALAR